MLALEVQDWRSHPTSLIGTIDYLAQCLGTAAITGPPSDCSYDSQSSESYSSRPLRRLAPAQVHLSNMATYSGPSGVVAVQIVFGRARLRGR